MPLWVADFLAKTSTLEAKEVGAYMLLLMSMWSHDGTLPADQKKLQRVARCGRDWPKIWDAISHYFDEADGVITNSRLSKELQKVATKREVNAQHGALGGKAKALKSNDAGLANATVSLERKASIPEPYPDTEREEGKPSSCVRVSQPDLSQDFADFWEAYPHRNGQKKNRKGAFIAFLKAIKAGVDVAKIAAGVTAMQRAPDVLRGYARDPTTWLHAEGWNDEIPEHTDSTNGRNHDNRTSNPNFGSSPRQGDRVDPALEQIARLTGLSTASGDDRVRAGGFGEKDGPLWMGARPQ